MYSPFPISARFFAILFLSWLLTSCASIKPEKPKENYSAATQPELKASYIGIPLNLNIADIERMLNTELQGLIYEDNDLSDNIAVKAWKRENFKIGLVGNTLEYRVPLKLWIKAGWKVEKFGIELSDYREIEAEIALKFKTNITLNPDWSLTTTTTGDGYEWLSSPVVKIGPVNLPIKTIADLILKTNQKTINKSIDESIKENVNLKSYMQQAWTAMQKPVKVNDEYNMWLKVTPLEIESTPLIGEAGKLKYSVAVKSITEAYIDTEPAAGIPLPLPKLVIKPKVNDGFKMNLVADIPFKKINEISKQYMKDKSFQQGKYTLLVRDIDIYGGEGKLVVHLLVSGSIKGDLYFTAVPYYNAEKQSITVKDLDYEIHTKNALVKTGSWLFKSILLKMISESMEYPMSEQVNSAKSMIRENIKDYQVVKNIYLNGNLDELSADDIILTQTSLKANIVLTGNLKLIIR
jgi:hypothetical protein